MDTQVDLLTLKKLAHRAQPVLEAAGLKLGHKQCLEVVARMHGFENFEAAKALLQKTPSKASSGDTPPEVASGSPEDMERRRRQALLALKIGPELQTEPEKVIGDLCGTALAAMARRFPAKLSAADRAVIRTNYPRATDDLMDERSMDTMGFMVTLTAAELMARIAVDYSSASEFKRDMDMDARILNPVGNALAQSIEVAMDSAVQQGLTPFGAMCTAILLGTFKGKLARLPTQKLVRPLLDGLKMALGDGPTVPQKEVEEAAMQAIMKKMGVGKAEAKKYLAAAKKMGPEEDRWLP